MDEKNIKNNQSPTNSKKELAKISTKVGRLITLVPHNIYGLLRFQLFSSHALTI